jgi:hypothetical protein
MVWVCKAARGKLKPMFHHHSKDPMLEHYYKMRVEDDVSLLLKRSLGEDKTLSTINASNNLYIKRNRI